MFSVIIPCYNAEKWIEECIQSVLDQDFHHYEIIVVDNESTDGTLDIVNRLADKHDFIVSSAPNIYPNCWDEARNLGFEIAKGKYLVTVCSDDVIAPYYLSNLDKFFEKVPQARVVQSYIEGIDNGAPMFMPYQGHTYATLEEFKEKALQGCPVTSPSVVFNRDLWDQGYIKTKPELYSGAADYDLYCRLAHMGIEIMCIAQSIGYKYRWHPEQATWDMVGSNYDKSIQDFWREMWKTDD